MELKDGELCLNSRTLHPEHPRAQAFSYDSGLNFEAPQLPENLVEQAYNECGYTNPARGGAPGCQVTICVSYGKPGGLSPENGVRVRNTHKTPFHASFLVP